ncbi:conserved hypothetical protein [Sporisorium reilianum SRZ2]|uniref:Uncharacterized protein n=1 Tax=Sporisorium reilianum (strain SRZ2) TaxID=999809 RepID=E6ZJR8_SPORE|nr:conserved hypothetical protein [Sporisorium reilianum SRZ2]
MSQSTPTQTPSRRRVQPVDTPGSARSTTSATDRGTLLDRVEELDLEVHDLRRRIAAERARRRPPRTAATLSLSYLDPSARDGGALKQVLADKLRALDDDALTALLTASSAALGRLVGGEVWVVEAGMVPSRSVGVEGTGSASDIDRRLRAGGVAGELSAARHASEVNGWLKDRQRRLGALLDALLSFSHLEIDTLSQTESSAARTRSIRMAGNIARLFPLDIAFDVVEHDTQSPQIHNLHLTLPAWLVTTLNTPRTLYTRLLAHNDLPAILLMLRTMVPLLALRRNLFSSLLETYTNLARDHVRAWEAQHRVDFTPFHPPSASTTAARKAPSKIDDALGRSLILPAAAETFTLANKAGASLDLRFSIRWNRFGHAYPHISATPHVPANLADANTSQFLQGFDAEFQHLLKVAVAQNGIVGLPDHDAEHDDELDPTTGRWGIAPAIHATVKAFFNLEHEEGSASSSMEQE